ncbi:MAG: type II toxin-antitoxin system prevent-host-death family antitoxin [Gammaproteobacteria bacterium]|nr:type II toxin-antitoxin system prevent-host-death family antitoxin [Gammaproteobacteria bacterium]MYF58327.1 type II toxin-antitoxin system prevent-host-death family antitoxin [Gammaproteobacteria bacterium]MYH32526.1 type II toxin-antitoxin system prevent-host-death family antitoxin [Gammaproteobacteria bacterium]
MSSISMVELRQDAEGVLRRVKQGENLILTYRGKPAARLTPYAMSAPQPDDPLYRLPDLAAPGGESLRNEEIDAIVYGG